ncbi:hypothetical protein ACG83_00050 [Frankia sp. R43]|nr:hypothetical protein ACG83_00050 [Frankia sp. R43]
MAVTPEAVGAGARPVAYGYICVQHEDEDVISELHDAVTAFAEREGLGLREIYVDRNVWPGQTVRPGLVVLLDAVAREETGCVVVVPITTHLSPAARVREAVTVGIEQAGGRVVVVEEKNRGPRMTED